MSAFELSRGEDGGEKALNNVMLFPYSSSLVMGIGISVFYVADTNWPSWEVHIVLANPATGKTLSRAFLTRRHRVSMLRAGVKAIDPQAYAYVFSNPKTTGREGRYEWVFEGDTLKIRTEFTPDEFKVFLGVVE